MAISPKEKAEDLVAKFFQFKPRLKFDIDNENEYYHAKKCALIAVYEILKEYPSQAPKDSYEMERHLYWQEVKQEIEKL